MTIKANRLKFWVSYLDACERLIEKKQFQIAFVSSRTDSDNSKYIHLTLAPFVSADILKTIKQCRQGDSINLYTIKQPKKHQVISTVSHSLSFKKFYQQHYRSDSLFLLTDDTGAVIGCLPPKIIEKQSELRTSEKFLIEIKQEIDFADFKQISAKFESLNLQTHTLKVLLSEEHIELNSISGIITNPLIGDLYPIRIQKDAIKRLQEKANRLPGLLTILFGHNEELTLPAASMVPKPLEKCPNIDNLNEHQRLAIKMIQASPDFFLLQGPPGTGKSTVNFVYCCLIALQGGKILISCQSNSAVDNVLSKLPKHPSILAVRVGESTKISKDALEFFEKNAVIRWLRSVAEECDRNLPELQKKASLVDLFVNHWEKIFEWADWQQQRIKLLAATENKKSMADQYHKTALELKKKYLATVKIEQGIKALIEELQTHQFTYEFNHELQQLLTQLQIPKIAQNLNKTKSNLWEIATEIKQLILDIKPDGYIVQLKKDFILLYEEIRSNISNQQDSLKRTQEIRDKIAKIRPEIEKQQNIVQKLKHLLDQGITDESSEVVSFSSSYTSISDRLSRFINLITPKKPTNTTIINFITIFFDAFKIWRRKINVVQLIRSWEEAEINLLPNRINQYEYIYNKFINLKRLSALFIVGRLYKPVLHRAKEQLKSSIENLSIDANHFYHAKNSSLAIKIYDEYNSELQIAEAKVTELSTQYDQEVTKVKNEKGHYKTLLEDAQSWFDEAEYFKEAFSKVFDPYIQTIDLIEVEDNLEIEELMKVNENLISMAAFIEEFIPFAENKIIQPFQHTLSSVYDANLSSQNESALSEQSASEQANSLNKEYDKIMAHIKFKDDKYKLGHRIWEELRTQKSVPGFFDKPIPDLEFLNLEREPWLSSVGGETEAKRLETKIKIKEDWIARIRTGNIEISDQLYELFLKHANVVGATCIHTGKKSFLNRFSEFNAVIVDEVSKATPTELLVPCLLGKKIVLVGDYKQLPPIFGEESCFIEAAQSLGVDAVELQKQLTTSLFKERYEYLDKINASRTLMLIKQYRMHSQIMSAINPFYGNQLIIGYKKQDSERAHRITIPKLLTSKHHLMWVDLPLDDSDWYHQQIGTGRQNPSEAELIISILMKMKKSFVHKRNSSKIIEVGITSVYKAQTNLIKSLCNQKNIDLPPNVTLTIGTVDEFQGMEKDIMFVSLVLNKPGVLPSEFLQTPERINVAMSRGRKLLIITGSSHNYTELKSEASPIYKHILNIAKNHEGHSQANAFMD
ncbi:translation initiation factor IF-2 domain-containing protein [Calothrix sp. NIES-4071]|nr:translation initiation factor IF-2 domain-containing protein [Calothrix sp. NIES-4071]BAZ60811.1 translation initiation factor IF-2 domain-containing protein [Calothrix sp. NIES-4105]